MAVFVPDYETIVSLCEERFQCNYIPFLMALDEGLDDRYTVYYQPPLSILRPSFVITRLGKGVLIVEVENDLALKAFHGVNGRYGYVTFMDSEIRYKTPFERVLSYKYELYDFLSPELSQMRIEHGKAALRIVQTAVFFCDECYRTVKGFYEQLDSLLGSYYDRYTYERHVYRNQTTIWCKDDLPEIVNQIERILRCSLYDDSLHSAFTAMLYPSFEVRPLAPNFQLSSQQAKSVAYDDLTGWTEVRGITGSGKTTVIAQKAVNRYNQTRKPVLILFYNIMLRNYIMDKIVQCGGNAVDAEWLEAFELVHFDKFLSELIDRMSLMYDDDVAAVINADAVIDEDDVIDGDKWDIRRQLLMGLIRKYKNEDHICCPIPQYETILIDDAQDFKSPWIDFLKDVVLAKGGEISVSIEDVNVTSDDQDDQNILTHGYRMNAGNTKLALAFQEMSLIYRKNCSMMPA